MWWRCDEVDAPFDRVIVAARRVSRTLIDTNRALGASISRRATRRPRDRVETSRLYAPSSRTARRRATRSRCATPRDDASTSHPSAHGDDESQTLRFSNEWRIYLKKQKKHVRLILPKLCISCPKTSSSCGFRSRGLSIPVLSVSYGSN